MGFAYFSSARRLSNKLLRILSQLVLQQVRRLNRLAVLNPALTLHGLLYALWRDALLDHLVIHPVQLVLLLAQSLVVEYLLVSLVPVGLGFDFKLHIVHGRLRPVGVVQAWVFHAHFLEHAVSAAYIFVGLVGGSPHHACSIATCVVLRRRQVHLVLLLSLVRPLNHMRRLTHNVLPMRAVVSAGELQIEF